MKAIIVKREKVLLPSASVEEPYWTKTKLPLKEFLQGGKRYCIDTDILIEKTPSVSTGYGLYGTDIPVRFVYLGVDETVSPFNSACIGVICDDRKNANGSSELHCTKFDYDGKKITDEEIIEWLENQKNIMSMRYIRECCVRYAEEMKQYCIKKEEDEKLRQEQMLDLQGKIKELVKKYTD